MIVIGLTGSIGMGKSTAASMLKKLAVSVHEADAEVHALLMPGSKAYKAVAAAFPYFEHPQIYSQKNKNGVRIINRKKLGAVIFGDNKKRKKLESILHPLVRDAQNKFIRTQKNIGREIVALDIPLLFETGAEDRVDYIIVVTAPAHVQRARVLDRPGMDPKKFRAILKHQIPDREKRRRADYVVQSGLGRAQMMKELKTALQDIRKKKMKKKQ